MKKTYLLKTVAAILVVTAFAIQQNLVFAQQQATPSDANENFLDAIAKAVQNDRTTPLYTPKSDDLHVEISRSNTPPDQALLEELVRLVRSTTGDSGFVAEQISVGQIDLNGDGRDEIITYFSSSYFCGTAPECDVSIYHHDGTAWHFVGSVRSIYGNDIYFQATKHNGWHAYQYDDWSLCWHTPEEIRKHYRKAKLKLDDYGPLEMSDNDLGQKIDPNFGGYIYIQQNEPCWKQAK